MKEITLRSGRKVNTKQLPRYVLWRHGRAAQTFQVKSLEIAQGEADSINERGLSILESLSVDEAQRLQAYVDDVIKNSTDIGDVDLLAEDEYWEIFRRTLYADPDVPIKTEDGETDTKSVETFPLQSEVSAISQGVSDVSGDESGPKDGDSQSAGA